MRGLVVRRRAPRAHAESVLRAQVIQQRALVFDMVYVLDAAGKAVIRITGQNYARTDMDRLEAFLGLPRIGPSGPVRGPQLDAMYPGVVPWYEAHPVKFGMAGTAVAVAAAIILTIALQFAL